MKIGLVRHFKVIDHTRELWMTASEFNSWVEHYDQCDLKENELVHPVNWERCYSSNQLRAAKTAQHIFKHELVITDLLREVSLNAVTDKNIKLHRLMWLASGRIAWMLNHVSQEGKQDTLLRAKTIIDEIEQQQDRNVLLVSHGAFMRVLKAELKSRGYTGAPFLIPRNGKVYLYEKES